MAEYPKVAVDVIVGKGDSILLIKRKNEPFSGMWALPGGFVEDKETVEQAAVREVKEETGIDIELEGLIGVYSEPGRDPRGHVISVVFAATAKNDKVKANPKEVDDFRWALLAKAGGIRFAFDHATMVEDFAMIRQMEAEG
jgi:8-oxo-dGTP diphosphatase